MEFCIGPMFNESAVVGKPRAFILRSFFSLLLLLAAFNGAIRCQARKTPLPSPSPTPAQYAKNGLRLVRTIQPPTNRTSHKAAGIIGRLEVKVARIMIRSDKAEWAPLCDDGSFDAWRAQEFCDILGFKYGIKYNGTGISSSGSDEASQPRPFGDLKCFDQPWQDGPATFSGWIDFSSRIKTYCYFFSSECPSGQLVALQCSNSPLSPPLPPRPSSSPPPDRSLGTAIRHVNPEANLVFGPSYGMPFRVELLVNSSADGRSGEAVWAPLCASPEQLTALRGERRSMYGDAPDIIANTSCFQNDYFSNNGWYFSLTGYALSPALIPEAPSTSNKSDSSDSSGSDSGLFDPAIYTRWVTIVDEIRTGSSSLQRMRLNVSATPCESGYLFMVGCAMIVF
ncbi:hypothetical protein Vretimale_2023 [Volvox reticuliferus]|nr:hypothetical protein Vretimale_2023 [Volvox reticuliferus]